MCTLVCATPAERDRISIPVYRYYLRYRKSKIVSQLLRNFANENLGSRTPASEDASIHLLSPQDDLMISQPEQPWHAASNGATHDEGIQARLVKELKRFVQLEALQDACLPAVPRTGWPC